MKMSSDCAIINYGASGAAVEHPLPHSFLPNPRRTFRMVLYGSSMSGKTNVVRNLLFNDSFGMYEYYSRNNIFLISPTLHDDDAWKSLNLPKHHAMTGWRDKTMKEVVEYSGKQDRGCLIILDDCAGDTQVFNSHKVSTLCQMMMVSRHQGVSWLLTSQYFKWMPGIVRSNATHVVAFRFSNTAEERSFLAENADLDIEPHYRSATEERFSFIYINRQQGAVFRKFEEQLI